ncbi:MAG: glycosyltransferase [Pseudomonadota bacterium]
MCDPIAASLYINWVIGTLVQENPLIDKSPNRRTLGITLYRGHRPRVTYAMNVLFLHRNFPGQYRHVVKALNAQGGHQLAAICSHTGVDMPNVDRRVYQPSREPNKETHHYVKSFESSVLIGQSVFRQCMELRKTGFRPDVICAHSGYGLPFFVHEAFPGARLMGLFEWFYRARGSDADFLPEEEMDADRACRIEMRNAAILTDLARCDHAIAPTQFQLSQFPKRFHDHIEVLHEGIDVEYFTPEDEGGFNIEALDLRGKGPIVTYATRGMEPYRGFPQFMAAAEKLQAERPDVQIVIAGTDRVAYGRSLPDGQTFRQLALETHKNLDHDRLHFVGQLNYRDYRSLLRASDCHVYLTIPFVLSWSLMEAMSLGCLIVSSDTAPVREVMTDNETGLLVDFFDVDALTAKILFALDNAEDLAPLRTKARQIIVERFPQPKSIRRFLALLNHLAGIERPASQDQA